LLVCAGLTGALWLLVSPSNTRLVVVLYVWTGVYSTLMTVQFWLAVSARYTVTHAKRLFGLIAAGGIIGAIIGSILARMVAMATETRHMLLVACLCMVSAAPAALWVLGRRRPLEVSTSDEHSLRSDVRAVAGSRYLVRLTALIVVATVTVTFSSFMFKREVAATIEPSQLAVFFATTNLVVNGVGLFIQVLAAGWILDRFGALRALSILPFLLLMGGGAFAAGGGLFAALLLQGGDGTLRHSLHRTAIEVLYVPVPGTLRPAGKAVADVLGHRGGQALGSLAIMALLLVPLQAVVFGSALVLLCALWIGICLSVRPHYLGLFRRTLTDNTMTETIAPLDKSSLEELFAALNSRRDERVIAAVDLLAAHGKMPLVPALILHHPSEAVVTRALELFTQAGRSKFVPVAMRLVAHADPQVRAAALRAVTSVVPSDEAFEEALKDQSRRGSRGRGRCCPASPAPQ
jgi:AAA family ATP:ADP antiporter